MKKCTYLIERNYCQSKSLDKNDKGKQYWEDVLGKEIYEVVNSNGRIDNVLAESLFTSSLDLQENYIWKCLCDARYKNYNLILTNEFLQEKFVFSRCKAQCNSSKTGSFDTTGPGDCDNAKY